MIPNTAFSPSVSLVHKWANAVAAEMGALHWGAERVFYALVGGCAVYAAELACLYFLEREGGRYDALLFTGTCVQVPNLDDLIFLFFGRYTRRGGGLLHVVDSPLVFFFSLSNY